MLTSKLIAGQFYLSVSELNVLFKLACGISVMEYVRNRRLTLAGEELMNSNIPIIDLALKYGYETPEAFTKAFAGGLNEAQIQFKVDSKTMIFAHGLEFKLDKICLTFRWKEEQKVQEFFQHEEKAKSSFRGFKYFDTMFKGRKIRCMFYGDCPGDDTEDFLFRNTEPVEVDGQLLNVQTLEFYYQNADPKDEYYNLVAQWLNRK